MRRNATIAIALVAGIAAALFATAVRNQADRNEIILDGLRSPKAELRREAWKLVPANDGPGPSEITSLLLDPPNPASPAALADAAREFKDRAWKAPAEMVDAAASLGDPIPLLAWLETTWPLEPGWLGSIASGLRVVLAEDRPMAEECLDLLFAVDSADHRAALRTLIENSTGGPDHLAPDSPLGRSLLALSLLGSKPSVDPTVDPWLLAAAAFLVDPAGPSDVEFDRLPAWLRVTSIIPEHLERLKRRAEEGDVELELALAMQDDVRVIRAEQRVLGNRDASPSRRSLAASRLLDRLDRPGDATLLGLLADGPADPDGTVHAAAILAWRGLSPTAVRRIETRWLGSDDPDDLRAAMVLGVLRRSSGSDPDPGVDPTLIAIDEHARSEASPPRVRRTARLAARALDLWPFDPVVLDPNAYAARATRLADGRVDPDAVLLGLLADDPLAERRLVSAPASASGDASILAREIGWRVVLARLHRPDWMNDVGDPIPGNEDDLRLWVDVLAARRLAEAGFAPRAPSEEDQSR